MTLALVYAVTAVPKDIHASTPDATSVVDLHVSIAPPQGTAVDTVKELTIQFGDGSEGSTLSDKPFPSPTPAPDPHLWTYDDSGEWPIMIPTAPVDAAFDFTLRDVEVNETPGEVPVSVIETPGAGRPVTGLITTLEKLQAPLVTLFSATPPSIDTVDETVTLSWTVVRSAVGYLFRLRSSTGSKPQPVQVDKTTGKGSLPSPKLSDDTRFWLDVIDASSGAEVTIAKASLLVPLVGIPRVTHATPAIRGLNATLRWTTVGPAASCTVRFDGHDHVVGAPADTWDGGLPVFLGLAAPPDVSVVAVSATGATSDPFPLGVLRPDEAVHLSVARGSGAVALSDDGRSAYVGTDKEIAVVDLTNRALHGALVPIGNGAPSPLVCEGVAFARGDPSWVVTIAAGKPVFVSPDDPSKWAIPPVKESANDPHSVPLLGFVGGSAGGVWAFSLDPGGGGEDPSLVWWTVGVDGAFHSDDTGTLGIVSIGMGDASPMILGDRYGMVFLRESGHAEVPYEQLGSGPVTVGATKGFGIAGGQDGSMLAFALDPPGEVGSRVSVAAPVAAVGITPDGARAFAATSDQTLHSIDIAASRVDEGTLDLGFPPAAIAVSPTWPAGPVVVTGTDGSVLVL